MLEMTAMDGSSLLMHTLLDLMLPLHQHPEVSIAAGMRGGRGTFRRRAQLEGGAQLEGWAFLEKKSISRKKLQLSNVQPFILV